MEVDGRGQTTRIDLILVIGVALAREEKVTEGSETKCRALFGSDGRVQEKDGVIWIKISVGWIRGVDRFRVFFFLFSF